MQGSPASGEPVSSSEAPKSTPPPTASILARSLAAFILTPLRYLRRHPWRAMAGLMLLAIIGGASAIAGIMLWTDFHLRAARQAVERGHNAEAVGHLMRCRQFRPNHPEVILLCARVARRSGAWNECEFLLNSYSQLHGEDEVVVLERLLLRATIGEVDTVAPVLQERINRNDSAARLAREALISGHLYLYRLDVAAKMIDDWLQRDPRHTIALMLRGKLQEQRERESDALETYRQALEIDPEYDEVRLRMTEILLAFRQGAEAVVHLEYLRRRMPNSVDVLAQLGQALDLQGRIDEARSALDECLQLNPNHATALLERGRIARGDGDLQKAEDLLARSVQAEPGNTIARHQYFLALNANGKIAEANVQLAEVRQVETDIKQINDLMRDGLRDSPNDPAVRCEVAKIARRARLPKEALRWLQRALQIDPNYLPAHQELSSLYYQLGNPILSTRHRAIARQLATGSREP